MAALRRAIDVVVGGRSTAVVVRAPAGAGKSRLLDEVAVLARRAGLEVRRGGVVDPEDRPLGALQRALRGSGAHAGESAQVDEAAQADDGALADEGAPHRLVAALAEQLELAAAAGGAVLAVDDLHRADAATCRALQVLHRRTADLPVLLLLALRPRPVDQPVATLLAQLEGAGGVVLTLAPLDDDAVAQIAADVRGAPTSPAGPAGPAPLGPLRAAGGNPLFVRALLVGEDDDGVVGGPSRPSPDPDPAPAELQPPERERALQRAVARVLDGLGQDARIALRAVALLGDGCRVADVEALASLPADRVVPAIEALLEAGVLRAGTAEDPASLAVGHDVVRTAVLATIAPPVRVALHRRAAVRLADRRAPALLVAAQLLAADPRGEDPWAARWLAQAGDDVLATDPSAAAAHLGRAVGLLPQGVERDRVALDHVVALLHGGEVGAAASAAERALAATADAEARAWLRLRLAEARAAAGDLDGVLDVAAAVRRDGAPASVLAQLHAQVANVHDLRGEHDLAERAARTAVEADVPDGVGRVMGLEIRADVARLRGDLHGALRFARAAVEAIALGAPRPAWPPEVFVGMALHELDRLEEAADVARAAAVADERDGRLGFLPTLHAVAAAALAELGRWDDAVVLVDTAITLADEVELGALAAWPRAVGAVIALRRGRIEDAEPLINGAAGGEGAVPSKLWHAEALLQEARGEAAAAHDLLVAVWHQSGGHGPLARTVAPDLIRSAVDHEDRECLLLVGAGLDDAAQRVAEGCPAGGPACEPAALTHLASLARACADGEVDALVAAATCLRDSPRPVERAVAAELVGRHLAAVARRPDASAWLREAASAHLSVDAAPGLSRVLAVARAHDLPVRRPRGPRRPRTGWASLTPAELDVVRIAAAGSTNPEIAARLHLSPRTIQSHLASTYRKLGIGSRVELAALVAARDIPPGVAEHVRASPPRSR